MATKEKELAFLFYESYWRVLENMPTQRKRSDMCGALVEAFFTGESCADRFKGEVLAVYMQLEERMRAKQGGKQKVKQTRKQKVKQKVKQTPSKHASLRLRGKRKRIQLSLCVLLKPIQGKAHTQTFKSSLISLSKTVARLTRHPDSYSTIPRKAGGVAMAWRSQIGNRWR